MAKAKQELLHVAGYEVAVSNPDPDARGGIKPYAVDPARAAALWDRTEEWIAVAERA